MKWECQGNVFQAKGKRVLQQGWKIYEECFKNKDGIAIEDPAEAQKDRIPDVKEGHSFFHVTAVKTEHFTSPPKQYTEDTLLSAMETAGNKEFASDTEKKGLGNSGNSGIHYRETGPFAICCQERKTDPSNRRWEGAYRSPA